MFNLTLNGTCFCGASITATVESGGKTVAECKACGSKYPVISDGKGIKIEKAEISTAAVMEKAIDATCTNLGIARHKVRIKTPIGQKNVNLKGLAGSLATAYEDAKRAAEQYAA